MKFLERSPEMEDEAVLSEANRLLGAQLAIQVEPLVYQSGYLWERVEKGDLLSQLVLGPTPAGPVIAYAALENIVVEKKRGLIWKRWIEKKPFVAFFLGTDEGNLSVGHVHGEVPGNGKRHVARFRVLFTKQEDDKLVYEAVEARRYSESAPNGRAWKKVGPARANLILSAAVDAMCRLTE